MNDRWPVRVVPLGATVLWLSPPTFTPGHFGQDD